MTVSKVDVGAVIVTYNSRDHVSRLLDSLPEAMDGLTYSVVVVDNGSSDGTIDLLSARPELLLVRSSNEGYSAGVNKGVRYSPPSEAVLVLNPDTTLDPGSVSAMLAVMRRRPSTGVVAPRVREADGTLSPTLRRGPTLGRVGGLSFTGLPAFTERIEDASHYQEEHEVDWAVGAILLIGTACFDMVGGLDESFFLYSEETDFSLRARDAGWATVYTPAAGAMHVGGGSGESARTHTMKVLNRLRLYRRRSGTARSCLYFVLTLTVEARRAVLGHRRSWPTLVALVRPSARPPELRASDSLIPR